MQTPKITVTYQGVDFTIQRGETPARFIFGLRKSGSSIMNSMFQEICNFNQLNYIDIPGKLFEHGVPVSVWQQDPQLGTLFRPGNVYLGFRNAPYLHFSERSFAEARGILLVRDPRDALSSEYFSNAYTHSIPEAGPMRLQMLEERQKALAASIAVFAANNAARFLQTLHEYRPLLNHPGVRIYHYEKAILDKRWFLKDAAAFLDMKVSDSQIEDIIGWADQHPDEERPDQFVRRVKPGDYLEKFDAETIAYLNVVFGEEASAFGYKL